MRSFLENERSLQGTLGISTLPELIWLVISLLRKVFSLCLQCTAAINYHTVGNVGKLAIHYYIILGTIKRKHKVAVVQSLNLSNTLVYASAVLCS